MPSVRAIEKEAYRWADLGIDTLEEAAVYMQNQLQLQSRAGRIRQVLQIADRRLTPGEEKLIHTWLSWGFGEDEILPWSTISVGVSDGFFRREREKAYRSEVTPDCRTKCAGCGARRLSEEGKCDESAAV